MQIYSQKDPRWANLKINGTNSTLKNYGCFVCSLSSLAGLTPDVALKKLEEAKAFNKDLIISDKAAEALDLEFDPIKRSADFKPTFDCIVEVDYKPNTPAPDQHFCVAFVDGTIGDPLDGKIKRNPYRVISYRLFKAKSTLTKEEKEFAERKGLDTLDKAIKKAFEYRNERNQATELADEAREECARLQKILDEIEANHLKELLPLQVDLETLKKENDVLKYGIDAKNEQVETDGELIAQLKQEIDRLNNIQGLNVEKTTISQAFSFLLSVIFKKNVDK